MSQTICYQCRHCQRGVFKDKEWCDAPSVAPNIDLVTGVATRPLCSAVNSGNCGHFQGIKSHPSRDADTHIETCGVDRAAKLNDLMEAASEMLRAYYGYFGWGDQAARRDRAADALKDALDAYRGKA